LYGGDWLLETRSGPILADSAFDGSHYYDDTRSALEKLNTYFRDIRWVIDRGQWRELAGVVHPNDQADAPSGARPVRFATEGLRLDESAADHLLEVGVDSVTYDKWSLRRANSAESLLYLRGEIVLGDGSSHEIKMLFDVYEDNVYLTFASVPPPCCG
jgi:hypothetical protein